MDYDSAINWLSTWRAKEIATAVLGAVGGLILAAVLLVLAWGFIFMVTIFVGLNWIPYVDSWVFPLIATIAIPLLFVGNACVRKETLGKYELTTGTATDKLVTIPGYGSNVNPLAPNSIITVLKIVADVLFCGPRVTLWSFRKIGRAFRLLPMDVPGCAAVLTVLHDAGQRMSYHDISESIEGLNPGRVFSQLRLVDGILFLESEPAGLSLGTDLRKELNGISQQSPAR
jgi:hypothetical protein